MLTIVNPRAYAQAFSEASSLLTRHWRLTVAMARRDLARRYSGQLLGTIWIIGHPVFLTVLYIFIFAVVFKMKLGNTLEMPLDYTAYILSGTDSVVDVPDRDERLVQFDRRKRKLGQTVRVPSRSVAGEGRTHLTGHLVCGHRGDPSLFVGQCWTRFLDLAVGTAALRAAIAGDDRRWVPLQRHQRVFPRSQGLCHAVHNGRHLPHADRLPAGVVCPRYSSPCSI